VNILITGVAGLLGSRLAEYILTTKPGVDVYGIDDLSGGYITNIPVGVDFHDMNVVHPHGIDKLFETTHFDVVYHCAAYAAEGLSPFIRRFNYTNNLLATANIVNLCIKHNVGRLVFTSSMAVYGEGSTPFDETSPRLPVDPYGVAKSACEQDIEIAHNQHGLDYCIIRPHNVYGRHQNIWDSYRNFIGIAMYKALNNDPITIYGDGLQTRAFSEMTDSLEPLWQAAINPKASAQIINLGGVTESTILDTANIVAELAGPNTKLIHLAPRHEVKHAYPTYQKSIDILGFEHKTELYDGIKNMWEWAKSQPKRDRFIWSKYELEKGLYPFWKPESLKDGFYK
jgi:UDP-glucose 4-epimerase